MSEIFEDHAQVASPRLLENLAVGSYDVAIIRNRDWIAGLE